MAVRKSRSWGAAEGNSTVAPTSTGPSLTSGHLIVSSSIFKRNTAPDSTANPLSCLNRQGIDTLQAAFLLLPKPVTAKKTWSFSNNSHADVGFRSLAGDSLGAVPTCYRQSTLPLTDTKMTWVFLTTALRGPFLCGLSKATKLITAKRCDQEHCPHNSYICP